MFFIKRLRQAAVGVAAIFAVPYGKKVEKVFSKIVDDKPTIYDEKIDKFYNETHIGGFTHRHFDASHTPLQMWEKVKETLPNDTNVEELKKSSKPEVSTTTEESDVSDISIENLKEEEAQENSDTKEDTEATNS